MFSKKYFFTSFIIALPFSPMRVTALLAIEHTQIVFVSKWFCSLQFKLPYLLVVWYNLNKGDDSVDFQLNKSTKAKFNHISKQLDMLMPSINAAARMKDSISPHLIETTIPAMQALSDSLEKLHVEDMLRAHTIAIQNLAPSIDWARAISQTIHPSIEMIKGLDYLALGIHDNDYVHSLLDHVDPDNFIQPHISASTLSQQFEQNHLEDTQSNENSFWTFDRIMMIISAIIMLMQIMQSMSPDAQKAILIQQNQKIIEELNSINEKLD